MRFLGLKTSIFWSRSTYAGAKSLRQLLGLLALEIFISLISDLDTSDSSDAISSSVGYPVNEHIFYIWSMVQLPANKGFCASISQMMQPKLQISAGVEYDLEPSSTSGDLYHLVATPSVSTAARSLRVSKRTSPKSQSLMVQLELTRMLLGLRSLWMILPECRYLRDLAI